MFGLFKKKNLLHRWNIPIDDSFSIIDNGDSWQFGNDDGSRVLYFSILSFTGSASVLENSLTKKQALITNTENGWVLKGTKVANSKILICVFSFTNEND